MKGFDRLQIENQEPHGDERDKREGDFQICVRHHGVTVLLEIKPLGIVEGTIVTHGRRPPAMPPTRPAEDPPAVPLKMWLVRAGIFRRA